MAAYWIAHVEVTDPDSYSRYVSAAAPVFEAHSGKFLARGGRWVLLEGAGRARNVLLEFPTLEAAEACYHSEAYQAARTHARGASVRDIVIVEGL